MNHPQKVFGIFYKRLVSRINESRKASVHRIPDRASTYAAHIDTFRAILDKFLNKEQIDETFGEGWSGKCEQFYEDVARLTGSYRAGRINDAELEIRLERAVIILLEQINPANQVQLSLQP